MRLIDGDVLWKRLNDEPWYNNADRDEIALPIVDVAPTVDAVIVTRCKDCTVPHNRWTGCPKLNGLVTPPDFYCSYGEMRKEE